MEVYLDHLKGERAGALDRFAKEVIRVGRSPEFELCFDDLGVSFEHAELRLRDGDFWLVDRGSTNGCYVNEERAYNARLREGDVVRFGKKGPVVRFRLTARADDAEALAAAPAAKGPEEPLADLPPLAAAPEGNGPVKRGRSRRLTIPNLPSFEPEPDRPAPPAPAPSAPPKVVVRPAAAEPSSSGDASSGNSSSLEARRAGERRAMAQRSPKGFWVAIGLLSVSAVLFAGAAVKFYVDATNESRALEDEKRTADTLQKSVERVDREKSDQEKEFQTRELRAKDDSRLIVDRLEQSLERERKETKRIDRESRQKIEDLQQELARAKGELAQVLNESANGRGGGGGDGRSWKVIQKRLARSIVLVACSFNMKKKDGTTEPIVCYGSGFFISKEGHIITNKHVVEPWKFRPLAQRIAQEDLEPDMKSYQLAVWIAETRFASGAQLDVTTGYSTQQKTLEKVRTPKDVMTPVSVTGDKGPRSLLCHNDNSNEDLALLKATGGPFEPIPLRRSSDGPLEKLDQVMVLGFPAGPSILEKGIAETSPSVGQVRKVEETIYVNASMIGGNSGGPCVDSEGRVIGVATRVVNAANIGTEALGICLKVEHVIDLYDGGSW